MVGKRRILFWHLSRLRRTIKKFAIVLLFMVVFVFMLLNKTNEELIEKTSTTFEVLVAPITKVVFFPATMVLNGYEYLRSLHKMDEENKALREENRELIIANSRNKALEIENKILADLLNYKMPPKAEFVTAKVIAQEGTAFAHSITVYLGENSQVSKGQVVISDKGVIGRVEEVGARYAKIAMINNINSRISVTVESSRVRGIMVGRNDVWPELIFLPHDAEVKLGDKIVTSGVGGVFPSGLPVGVVAEINKRKIRIKPAGSLSKLEYVMIVDYKLPDPSDELYRDDDK